MTLRAVTLAAFAALISAAPATAAPATAFSDLPGWAQENHAAALAAFRGSCGVAAEPQMARVCGLAKAAGPLAEAEARRFFEDNFRLDAAAGSGTLTAYFAPEYEARRAPQGEFTAPVRPKPADLADAGPYADRTAIEARPATDALAWMKPEELFLLQVQGSGTLRFPDGRRLKALYAATNGRPYLAIGGPMRSQGLLPGEVSADSIRAWLATHRGPQAQAVMQLNPRYAFFKLAPDDGRPPSGSAHVPLPAGRAIAIDTAFHAMGELLWIDADRPVLPGAKPTYRRLALSLDTGAAIRGPVRADLYLGEGEAAGDEAGRVHHRLRLYRLTPR
ncbi:MltA domain-containing protein [Phenylobacterium sp.]|uniref:MltA domain-containing protein n=1 Tax=Phenylobacterium sp. TaxID=1871053 RepID=UPI002DE87594|nr:MltA domain-containing protein [Phenylobacterium sp.]